MKTKTTSKQRRSRHPTSETLIPEKPILLNQKYVKESTKTKAQRLSQEHQKLKTDIDKTKQKPKLITKKAQDEYLDEFMKNQKVDLYRRDSRKSLKSKCSDQLLDSKKMSRRTSQQSSRKSRDFSVGIKLSASSKKINQPSIDIHVDDDIYVKRGRSKSVREKVVPLILSPSDKYARIGDNQKAFYFDQTRSPDDIEESSQYQAKAYELAATQFRHFGSDEFSMSSSNVICEENVVQPCGSWNNRKIMIVNLSVQEPDHVLTDEEWVFDENSKPSEDEASKKQTCNSSLASRFFLQNSYDIKMRTDLLSKY